GLTSNVLFLGKHSGRHVFTDKFKELGYDLSEARLKETFQQFKVLTDHKKEITYDDLFVILIEVQTDTSDLYRYEMDMLQVQYGTNNIPTATVELTTPDKRKVNGACTGSGSVEALYETLDRLIEEDLKLIAYSISYVGQG